MSLLFSTPHGSNLYGTAHALSDEDTFDVYENKTDRIKAKFAKQIISGKTDVLKTDLSTFMMYASKGVPQYLEAMYSRIPTVDKLGEEYRLTFRPTLWETLHTYRRTIEAFYMRGIEEDNQKFMRHAWRLYMNLLVIERGEAFNPRLSPYELSHINKNIDIHPLETE